MQGYVPGQDAAFAQSRECYQDLEDWMTSRMRRDCSTVSWRNSWVMLPGALRPATRKAAAAAGGKLATRLSPGEKNGRKRMAELACVYDAAPVPAPSSSAARAPVETQNATSARSRCDPSPANSSSNRPSGIRRGIRCACRGR